jgi:hypothetical protein
MKTTVFVLVCLFYCSVSIAQVVDLTGTWSEFEMTNKSSGDLQVLTTEKMKANGFFTDFFFMKEGKFKQTSNMSGSGTTDTYEGTWKLEENKLTVNLKIGDQFMDVVWDFEFKNEIMNLSRTSPDGSFTVINSFRRKP